MSPRRAVALGVASLAFGILALALVGGCGQGSAAAESPGTIRVDADADDPREFGQVPEFALVDQTGAAVTRATLTGRPFVLAAIFSTCTGPCPAVSARMAELQDELTDTDARLVSISVDPGFDTPERLATYADAYGAEPGRWLFLTGAEPEVHALVREGFLMAVERARGDDPAFGEQVSHDTRLVAVDARGRIRGWYSSKTDAGLERLRARMLFLARDPASR